MSILLDLFLQDFVNTNQLMGAHYSWDKLVNRRYIDSVPRVFSFTSGAETQHAVGQQLMFPDTDWFRIELHRPIPADVEHRFDCLQMLSATTHTGITVDAKEGSVLIKLTTRHRGLMNIAFLIRDIAPLTSPFFAVEGGSAIPRTA